MDGLEFARIEEVKRLELERDFSKEEVVKVLHEMEGDKAVLLKARLSAKRKAQSPWGFFPLKRSSLSKARFKRAFLSFFIKRKARFFELFVFFLKKVLI